MEAETPTSSRSIGCVWESTKPLLGLDYHHFVVLTQAGSAMETFALIRRPGWE